MTAMPDTMRPSLRRRLAGAARRDDGFVMIVALAMLAIGLAVGAAALAETLASRDYSNKDSRTIRAQQAADAGINAVLYQQNELPLKSLDWNGGPLSLGTLTDCVVPSLDVNLKVASVSTTQADSSSGVCPDSSGAGKPASGSVSFPVGDHAFYQARFIPGASQVNGAFHRVLNSKIVSVGYENGGNTSSSSGYVTRRVEAILAPIDPFQAIEAEGNLTISGIKLAGLPITATLNGNARANGSVTLPLVFANTNLSGGLLGSVTYGTTFSGPLIALSNVAKQTSSFTRSPVSISPSKVDCEPTGETVNDCSAFSNTNYNAATNTFSMSSGSVTFAPGDYVFCNFNATGGTVTANATAAAPVRIFIDSPSSARCSGNGLGAAPNQGNLVAANGFGNLIGNTLGVTGASGLQIYVVGDQAASPFDNKTSVTIGGTGSLIENYVVYAPTSKVTASNCAVSFAFLTGLETDACLAIQGAIIGDDVNIQASVFTQDLDLANYPLYSGLGAFHVQQYVECTPVYPIPTPDPTTGC
jgi:hypothetical protein